MIKLLWTGVIMFAVTIIPPFNDCAKSAIAGSISADSRRSIGLTSMPTDGATDWMTANWPIPAATAGSRRTAACVTLGAISLSSSNHFPHKLYSNIIKPVALPPGCDSLLTWPEPTGSGRMANTMGMECVVFSITSDAVVPPAKITSGPSAISSAACLRVSAASTPADVDPHVAPRSPTQLLEPFQKCQMARLRAGRVCAYPFQETDKANSLALLRTRSERPRRCAAKQCDEIASPHRAPLQADDRTLRCWRLHCVSRQIRAANVRFGSKAD